MPIFETLELIAKAREAEEAERVKVQECPNCSRSAAAAACSGYVWPTGHTTYVRHPFPTDEN